MFEKKYRQEMDQISLSEASMSQIVQAMTTEPTKKSHRPKLRTVLVAAIICILLTISALAISPSLQAQLAKALGSFAPYSQEISGVSAIDQDFEVSIRSVVTDQSRLKIYVQVKDLTGTRLIDQNNELSGILQRETGEDRVFGDCVGYDPETHTALFEIDHNAEALSALSEAMYLTVTTIKPQVYYVETSAPLPQELFSADTLESMTLENGQLVLKPGQTPAPLPGLEKAELSSMGFVEDGSFQILLRLADGARLFSPDGLHEYSILVPNLQINSTLPTMAQDVIAFEEAGRVYVGSISTEITPETLSQVTIPSIYGTITMQDWVIGTWSLPLQVENAASKVLQLTGAWEGQDLPTQLTLSPLGAMITGEYDIGYLGGLDFSILYADGSRLENVQVTTGRMSPNGLCILGNWDFLDPLALDQAAALELGPWYIPLTGQDAGVVSPITHP